VNCLGAFCSRYKDRTGIDSNFVFEIRAIELLEELRLCSLVQVKRLKEPWKPDNSPLSVRFPGRFDPSDLRFFSSKTHPRLDSKFFTEAAEKKNQILRQVTYI